MMRRKGLVLAGGTGSRLFPITQGLSKQLMPIYDKPMIYYPLATLMLAGIRDIALITTPQDQGQFRRLLGDGRQWGISLTYITQPRPGGLAQAYLLAEDFLNGAPSALVLGDNIFFGHGLTEVLSVAAQREANTVFGYRVRDPQRYGVVDMDAAGKVTTLVEKPEWPPSPYAVTGLYFLDHSAPQRAARLTPSSRGELEMVDLLNGYLSEDSLQVEKLGRGYAWLDTGTHASLLEAGNFVRTLQDRQGVQVGCPEEIAFQNGWIGLETLRDLAVSYSNTEYGAYLRDLEASVDGRTHMARAV